MQKIRSRMHLADPTRLAGHPFFFLFSSLSGSNERCILPLFGKSVLFFMCTIFHYPAFNHPFAHTLCFSPFPSAIPHSHGPRLAEHFTFSRWAALGFKELLSTIYLVSL